MLESRSILHPRHRGAVMTSAGFLLVLHLILTPTNQCPQILPGLTTCLNVISARGIASNLLSVPRFRLQLPAPNPASNLSQGSASSSRSTHVHQKYRHLQKPLLCLRLLGPITYPPEAPLRKREFTFILVRVGLVGRARRYVNRSPEEAERLPFSGEFVQCEIQSAIQMLQLGEILSKLARPQRTRHTATLI